MDRRIKHSNIWQGVRDHLLRRDDALAGKYPWRTVAREIASSALVRTALFGNDPNWGRFVSQVGNSREVRDAAALRCTLQGIVVFERGEPAAFDRAALSSAMAVDDVSLAIDLRDGTADADLLVSDLGYRYVEINAEYTT